MRKTSKINLSVTFRMDASSFGNKTELRLDSGLRNFQRKFWLLKKELGPYNELIEAFTDKIPRGQNFRACLVWTAQAISLMVSYGNC
jgi:hypothetical protein